MGYIHKVCNEDFLFNHLAFQKAELIDGNTWAQNKNNLCAELLRSEDPGLFLFYDCIATRNVGEAWAHGVGTYSPTSRGLVMPSDFPSIEHEIAHFLEMGNIERLKFCDMGMDSDPGKWYERGPSILFIGFSRELRTRQIQKILEGEIEGGPNCKLAKSMNDLTTNQSWHPDQQFSDFGKFKSAKEVEDYMIDLCNKVRQNWTQEKIRFEFKRRCAFMREHVGSLQSERPVAA